MTDRRTLLKAALAFLAAPLLPRSRAAVPTSLTPSQAGLPDACSLTCWLPNDEQVQSTRHECGTTNSSPLTLLVGRDRVTFAPNTLFYGHLRVRDGKARVRVDYAARGHKREIRSHGLARLGLDGVPFARLAH